MTVPNGDFNLKILLKEAEKVELRDLHANHGDETYRMLTIFPPLTPGTWSSFCLPREVIFLVDTSGSIAGESIAQAKNGLLLCLKELRPEDRFTIIRFADDYSAMETESVPASPTNLETAAQYIDNLNADGGTMMQPALDYALKIPKVPGHIKMIIFLTDGDVGNEDSLIRLLANSLGENRIFTFGIGSAPNEYLMRNIAEQGRGQARFIHSQNEIAAMISDLFQTLENPVLTDISLSWTDEKGQRIDTVEFFPNPCPDIFIHRPLQVFAKHALHQKGEITLSGNLNGKRVEYQYRMSEENELTTRVLEKMFAGKKIDDLMVKEMVASNQEEKEFLRREMIQISLDYQVLSQYTARVAVEEQISRHPDGTLDTVKVPVPLPKGWDPAQFAPTATHNTLLLLVGLVMIWIGITIYSAKYFWK